MADTGPHEPFVPVEALHEAAEALRHEDPQGSAEGHAQATAVGQFLRESDWTIMEDDGSLSDPWEPDLQSVGYGLFIGLIAGRRAAALHGRQRDDG